jgi:twitching motility two-component system response regulator PilG
MEKVTDKVQAGINAAREGDKALAYKLLKEATSDNPHSETGWLWLAGVCESPREAAGYLERVLEINPFNERALSGWKWVQSKLQGGEVEPQITSQSATCPLCLQEVGGNPDRCPSCKGFLDLSDLDALMTNPKVSREVMVDVIERFEDPAAAEDKFKAHFTLALAYFNLQLFDDGIPHLEIALRECPDGSISQAQLDALKARLGTDQSVIEGETSKPSVLVVDDSPTIQKLVEITLEKHGYEVLHASNGLEGLGKISERLPDLILLDITMPQMDGYQFCKTVKGNRETESIPVIMLSGKDGFIDRVKGRMAGMSDCITKPFDPFELVRMVNQYLDRPEGIVQ